MPTARRTFWETNEGFCDRCDRPDFLTDGLCRYCRTDAALTRVPATCVAGAFVRSCEVCGRDTTCTVCPRCNEAFVREMEDR